jgi:hypothetical protein
VRGWRTAVVIKVMGPTYRGSTSCTCPAWTGQTLRLTVLLCRAVALLCRAVPCCAVTCAPSQVWDLAIGAAAGVASVLVSMPMDVIKTYMQTHHGAGAAPGMAGQMAAFWQTGERPEVLLLLHGRVRTVFHNSLTAAIGVSSAAYLFVCLHRGLWLWVAQGCCS